MRQLESNLSALELDLPQGARDRLDELSTPTLPFPYFANQHAPALEFAGAQVDGVRLDPYPTLTRSDVRY